MTENVSHETPLSKELQEQLLAKARGYRRHVYHGGTLCSRCYSKPPVTGGNGYCVECRRQYQRDRYASQREEIQRLRDEFREFKRLRAAVGDG